MKSEMTLSSTSAFTLFGIKLLTDPSDREDNQCNKLDISDGMACVSAVLSVVCIDKHLVFRACSDDSSIPSETAPSAKISWTGKVRQAYMDKYVIQFHTSKVHLNGLEYNLQFQTENSHIRTVANCTLRLQMSYYI